MVSNNDVENYASFLKGDLQCFEYLVIKYRDQLVAFLYRYTKDIYLAQDLAQDAFVEIFVHKDRYQSFGNFKTYLFTIGRNKAVDYIRKNNKYMFVEEASEYLEPMEGLEDSVVKSEEKKQLYNALYKLKVEYQVAILLIDFEELSYQQAAQVMGKTLGQMKVLVHRARKALSKLMVKEGC